MKNSILIAVTFICFFSYSQNISISNKERSHKLFFQESKELIFIDKFYTDFHLKIENCNDLEIVCEAENSVLTGNVRFDIINSKNIVIKGLSFDNTKGDLFRIVDSKDIFLNNLSFNSCGSHQTGSIIRVEGKSSNIEVKNSYFEDNRAIGINIVTSSEDIFPHNVKIIKNKFKNIKDIKLYYPNSNGNGLECIVLGRGYYETMYLDLGVVVQENYFENIVGDCNEVISIKSSGNIIKENYFKDCIGSLTCRVGNANVLKGNTFVDGKKAIRIFGKDHIIENNVFLNNDIAIELRYADYLNTDKNIDSRYNQVEDLRIMNNIFMRNKNNIKTISKETKFNPINIKQRGNKFL